MSQRLRYLIYVRFKIVIDVSGYRTKLDKTLTPQFEKEALNKEYIHLKDEVEEKLIDLTNDL